MNRRPSWTRGGVTRPPVDLRSPTFMLLGAKRSRLQTCPAQKCASVVRRRLSGALRVVMVVYLFNRILLGSPRHLQHTRNACLRTCTRPHKDPPKIRCLPPQPPTLSPHLLLCRSFDGDGLVLNAESQSDVGPLCSVVSALFVVAHQNAEAT